MINQRIAEIFEEMSLLYEMADVDFKPRAYEKAAGEIRMLSEDLRVLYDKGGLKELDEIPTVGEGMAKKIEEFIKTKKISEHQKLKKRFPVNVREITALEGIGPIMVRDFYKKLGVKTLKQLEQAAKRNKIEPLKGYSHKTEQLILSGVQFLSSSGGRQLLGNILPLAHKIKEVLSDTTGVKQVEICGSIRRMQETIGDIDLVVTTMSPKNAIDAFCTMRDVKSVHKRGKLHASARLNSGVDADLIIVPPESYGSAVLHFTGSKSHNIALRKLAQKKGMKLNEYGLYKGKKLVAGKTEKQVYLNLDLAMIPAELRTNSGEIEAAQARKLPKLISYGSIKGDLQIQTLDSDGSASISEMADAAILRGLEYIAITDHTSALTIAGGIDDRGVLKQVREIEKLNKKYSRKGFRILKSSEIEILKDGSLDLLNSTLEQLDLVSGAIHMNKKMSRAAMTKRIVTAVSHPQFNILFHPMNRKLNKRPMMDFDMKAVIEAARKNRVALEIDAYPDRSDLSDIHVRAAVKAGVKLVIDTDAHSPEHIDYLDLGVAIARRGWVRKSDVLNTRSVTKLLAWFKK